MAVAANAAAPAPAAAAPPAPSRIHPLPKLVVDRIAAGEVVQRPASVAKELIENSLDADSTTIDIVAQSGGLRLLTVTDDGLGISPPDLQLAATRFATSKLVDFDDLRSIRTFGFRGEALASASMVGRLSITSRRRKRSAASAAAVDEDEAKYSASCAYRQTYADGTPAAPRPTPAAGREGTVVKVEDLFHNVPARRRAFAGARKEAEEYGRILVVAQRYAVHRAGGGVGIVCRKKGGNSDLNTPGIPSVRKLRDGRIKRRGTAAGTGIGDPTNADGGVGEAIGAEEEAATRDVIGHVFGSSVARELMTLRCGEGDVDAVSLAALRAMREEKNGGKATDNGGGAKVGDASGLSEEMGGDSSNGKDDSNDDNDTGRYTFAYKAFGLLTNGSFCAPKSSSAFVLFINDRLVESAPLRRAVESAYADSLPRGAKPFVYLSLELPGPHVDVNVHPTKREVAFLHEDRLCDALARATRDVLGSAQASRTFYAQALLPRGTSDVGAGPSASVASSSLAAAARAGAAKTTGAAGNGSDSKSVSDTDARANGSKSDATEKAEESTPPASQSKKRSSSGTSSSTSSKKPYDPKRLVRTNLAAPAGALEPFLVSNSSQSQTGSQSDAGESSDTSSRQEKQSGTNGGFVHSETCEFASGAAQSVDITVPGAFALMCRCQVERGNTLPPVQRGSRSATTANPASASTAVIRPKKVTPTQCSYSSIQSLRADVTSRAHRELSTKLRDSSFVGAVSRHRSLIQWGIELLMINHTELGRELFYQLALAQFGGAPMASLGEGVNVKVAIGQALQLEEDIASGRVGGGDDGQEASSASVPGTISETNNDLAEQATKCLADRADMLEEYYSLKFQQGSDLEICGKESGALMLVGLPVLLEGHSPPPHALPLFLLRLATEVDWNEERPCFEGVCTELGSFYSEIPYDIEADAASLTAENEGKEAGAISSPASEFKGKELIDEVAKKFVKHTLYPALSFLLVPPKEFASDGTVVKLALLSSLYKVFERC